MHDYAPIPERRDVDADIFNTEIIPAGQPVVLKGIAAQWSAVQKTTPPEMSDFLTARANDTPVSIFHGTPEIEGRYFYDSAMKGFNFDRATMPFKAFMGKLLDPETGQSAASLYMGSQPIPDVFPGLADAFPMPLAPQGVPGRIWIGNESVVSTHFDTDRNIACVVSGTRRFTLFPPQQIANLYPGPIEHNMAGPQVSLVDPEKPDIDKHPKFEAAQPHGLSAELGPGDGLYIPPLWWHHVRAQSRFNVLVNFWWPDRPQFSRDPMQPFVLSLLALRQLPEAERLAWKTLFDYFVFQTDGPPMQHLPDDVRGVLGPISEHRARAIWSYFISIMR